MKTGTNLVTGAWKSRPRATALYRAGRRNALAQVEALKRAHERRGLVVGIRQYEHFPPRLRALDTEFEQAHHDNGVLNRDRWLSAGHDRIADAFVIRRVVTS